MIAEYWMKKCGIPPILQMIVNGICYQPRPVVFEANGPMASIGSEWTKDSPFVNPRFVTLRRGVLMGDPLTKPVLHLVNILVRTTGAFYTDDHFLTNAFRNEHTLVSDIVKPMFVPREQTLQSKLEAAFSSKDEEEETEPMPSVPTSQSMIDTIFDRKIQGLPKDEPLEVPIRKV
jgi:hypothetical protein